MDLVPDMSIFKELVYVFGRVVSGRLAGDSAKLIYSFLSEN